MPNFRGRRFTNAHETLIWASMGPKARYTFNYEAMKALNEDLQMRSDWLFPICSGRRAAERGRRAQDPSDAEAGGAAPPHHPRLEPCKATSCSIRFSARAPRRRWPSGSAGDFIGIERDATYAEAARGAARSSSPRSTTTRCQVAKGKRAEPRIPFGALVELGLISPGTVLYDPAARHEAKVRADGSIACGGAQGSIHKIGAHGARARWPAMAGPSGITRRKARLKPIDALREAARAKLAPQG